MATSIYVAGEWAPSQSKTTKSGTKAEGGRRSPRGACGLLQLTEYQGTRWGSFKLATWSLWQNPKQVGTRALQAFCLPTSKYSTNFGSGHHGQIKTYLYGPESMPSSLLHQV